MVGPRREGDHHLGTEVAKFFVERKWVGYQGAEIPDAQRGHPRIDREDSILRLHVSSFDQQTVKSPVGVEHQQLWTVLGIGFRNGDDRAIEPTFDLGVEALANCIGKLERPAKWHQSITDDAKE